MKYGRRTKLWKWLKTHSASLQSEYTGMFVPIAFNGIVRSSFAHQVTRKVKTTRHREDAHFGILAASQICNNVQCHGACFFDKTACNKDHSITKSVPKAKEARIEYHPLHISA